MKKAENGGDSTTTKNLKEKDFNPKIGFDQ